MNNSNCSSTSCGHSCCGSCCCSTGNIEIETRQVVIDFLCHDYSGCELCQATEENLEKAISSISNVLELAGIEVILNKINIDTEELAIKDKFAVLPAIRVDGRDIQIESREIPRDSCEDQYRNEAHCRVWIYKGQEYKVPPVGLIAEGLLKSIFSHDDEREEDRN